MLHIRQGLGWIGGSCPDWGNTISPREKVLPYTEKAGWGYYTGVLNLGCQPAKSAGAFKRHSTAGVDQIFPPEQWPLLEEMAVTVCGVPFSQSLPGLQKAPHASPGSRDPGWAMSGVGKKPLMWCPPWGWLGRPGTRGWEGWGRWHTLHVTHYYHVRLVIIILEKGTGEYIYYYIIYCWSRDRGRGGLAAYACNLLLEPHSTSCNPW